MTRVVHCKKEPYDVLIDRTTKWGNPFRIGDGMTREKSLFMYRHWICSKAALLADLHEIRGKILGCWCKPEDCHGDILAELCDSIPAEVSDADS